MSTPNQDASSDGTFRSSITNPPTRRVETTRGQEGNDSHWQDLHRSVSDAYHPPSDLASASPISTQRTDSSEPAAAAYSHRQHSKHGNEGLNMRPPVLPPSKVPKASQNPSRGESSRSPAPPPLPQLPGLGKFSRLAPANTHSNDRPSASSDFPMDSAWRTSSPHSQRPLRSSAHTTMGQVLPRLTLATLARCALLIRQLPLTTRQRVCTSCSPHHWPLRPCCRDFRTTLENKGR